MTVILSAFFSLSASHNPTVYPQSLCSPCQGVCFVCVCVHGSLCLSDEVRGDWIKSRHHLADRCSNGCCFYGSFTIFPPVCFLTVLIFVYVQSSSFIVLLTFVLTFLSSVWLNCVILSLFLCPPVTHLLFTCLYVF